MVFGSGNMAHTLAMGSRLGLETEWNCCVSLQARSVELDSRSIRAQLPYGIESIRKHILYVDPIPLQVSMYSHCKSVSSRAMISILQDNHEVVCSIGSATNHSNTRCVVQSDLAISAMPSSRNSSIEASDYINRRGEAEPLMMLDPMTGPGKNVAKLAALLSSTCAMRLTTLTTALPALVFLVRESRVLLQMVSSCSTFVLHCNGCIVALSVTSFLLGLPPLVSAMQLLWIQNVVAPVLSLGCFEPDREVSERLAAKHNFPVRMEILSHKVGVFAARYVPTALVLLVCGVGAMTQIASLSVQDLLYLNKVLPEDELYIVQSFVSTSAVYIMLFHALTHISRHRVLRLYDTADEPTRMCIVSRCRRWMASSAIAICLHLVFLVVTCSGKFSLAARIPVAMCVVVLLWPIGVVLLDYPIKRWRLRWYTHTQKLRKLFFGTRLGMHSPRGDYEPQTETTDAATDTPAGQQKLSWWRARLFEWTTLDHGRMEQQCICCPHP